MYYEKVYLGHDDEFRRLLTADGKPVNLTGIYRVTFLLKDTLIDSETSPDAFDWQTYASDGVIVFSLGHEDIAAGRYSGILTVYSSDNPDGVSGWGPIPVLVT